LLNQPTHSQLYSRHMKTMASTLKKALLSGSYASIASALALLAGGVRDCRSAIAPVNAVSHWIWDEKALRRHEPSFRYTASGYVIHHLASIFWALAYEQMACRRRRRPSKMEIAADAATVAAVACVVDMRCTPRRLTPGFERHLSNKSLWAVYAAFSVGLALHGLLQDSDRRDVK
jgi:hypothetical protein